MRRFFLNTENHTDSPSNYIHVDVSIISNQSAVINDIPLYGDDKNFDRVDWQVVLSGHT